MEANAKRKARLLLRTVVVIGTVAAAVVAAACSSEDPKPTPLSIEPVANSSEAETPVDATPSPDGNDIYFIASTRRADPDGLGFAREPAIFKVSAKGGPITKLHEGAPLSSPFGITISDDGQTLFIADSSADTTEDRSDGKVFSMSAGGGAPSPLAGTDGLAPGGIEAAGDALYVTGRRDGKAGLFRTGLGGGNLTPVAIGDAFSDPSGVAIAKNGVAYVVDSGSAMHAQALASVVKVFPDGRTEILLQGLAVGHPGGIALANDDKTLLVSGLDPEKGTDVVIKVELAGLNIELVTEKIGDFYESAGLHRARNANTTGTVYVLGK